MAKFSEGFASNDQGTPTGPHFESAESETLNAARSSKLLTDRSRFTELIRHMFLNHKRAEDSKSSFPRSPITQFDSPPLDRVG